MKKRKHQQKKRIATSNWNKDDIKPAIKNKIRFIKNKINFTLNDTFIEDKEKLKTLFIQRNKPVPKYFIKLSNEMKNKNKVEDILRYANMYLSGNFKITDIEAMQKHTKKIIVRSRPNARIAKK